MNIFNKQIIVLFTIVIALTSCKNNTPKKENNTQSQPVEITQTTNNSEGFQLLKTTCYACHNPNAKDHDILLAPPMAAVKMRYKMQYKTETEFVNAIVSWATNPTHENAKMKEAVSKFKVMPNMQFKADTVKKIATYMYNNKLEAPSWFADHLKEEMHQKMKNNQLPK
jgi:mono/diheme cytochrome c family protein